MNDTGFITITVPTHSGPRQVPAERTPCEHLVINPSPGAENEAGFTAFGVWNITHIPTGMIIPTRYEHDVDTVRWMAFELAKSDVDWTLPADELGPVVLPHLRRLIAEADEADATDTMPGQIPTSAMRRMCDANARSVGGAA